MSNVGTQEKVDRLVELKLADIIPTPDNPRVINEKDPAFKELVASVKASGVFLPVHVRPHPTKSGKFDLRAGERRLRASKIAGRDTIPAIVHEGMTDVEAFELTFAENFVREDLTPLEQGRAVATLMAKHHDSVKDVAAVLGRSEAWVRIRSRLAGLISEWRTALADPEKGFRTWSIGMVELVARYEADMQREILKEFEDWWIGDLIELSLAELRKHLEEDFSHLLRSAPWIVKGVEPEPIIGGLPSCADCNKRLMAQGQLFLASSADERDVAADRNDDRCLDPECWKQKERAYLASRVAALRKKHPELVLVNGAGGHGHEEEIEKGFGARPLGTYQYDEVKKSTPGAQPAVVVDGSGVGHLKWIKPRTAGRSSSSTRATGKPTPLKERRESHESKRRVRALGIIHDRIERMHYAEIPGASPMLAMRLAYTFGMEHVNHGLASDAWRETSAEDNETVAAALWERVKWVLQGATTWAGNVTGCKDDEHTWLDALDIAAILGIDAGEIVRQVEAELPEPKAWANLNADGTPKAVTRKKKLKPGVAADMHTAMAMEGIAKTKAKPSKVKQEGRNVKQKGGSVKKKTRKVKGSSRAKSRGKK